MINKLKIESPNVLFLSSKRDLNILTSILKKKCPNCRKADLFSSPFQWTSPLHMPESCMACGQKFMPEPGFYYGAMFISYIFTSFIYLSLVFGLIYFFNFTVNNAFIVLLLIAFFSYIETARLSRSIWIHFIIKFNSKHR